MSDHRSEVATFMQAVAERHPHQPEFHQAVHEFASSVMPTVMARKDLQEAAILQRLVEPDRVLTFRVVWEDEDENVHVNRGYRVQFNGAIGPYKGGLRFHPTVNLSILKFLGFEQIFKNALTGLPMGGGKGGADFDPKGKSDREVMRFCQAFMTVLHRHIGKHTDVPAGDIGVGAREVGYMFGQYKRLANEWSGVLTGKGLSYGGSLIRTEATGYGCVYFTEEMLRRAGDSIEGKTCLVSGSGNVAQFCAERATQLGGKVVTLSDSGGFIHDPEGIDAEKLEFVKELKNHRRGRISEYVETYTGATFHAGQRPWGVDADVALPCATQNELDVDGAQQLIANGVKAVSEGANMPATLDAVHALQQAGVLFAPGKAANAGGVGVSGLEMSQNALRMKWTREEVDDRLRLIMRGIHEGCVEHGERSDGGVDYVAGANVAGFLQVAESMLAHGLS